MGSSIRSYSTNLMQFVRSVNDSVNKIINYLKPSVFLLVLIILLDMYRLVLLSNLITSRQWRSLSSKNAITHVSFQATTMIEKAQTRVATFYLVLFTFLSDLASNWLMWYIMINLPLNAKDTNLKKRIYLNLLQNKKKWIVIVWGPRTSVQVGFAGPESFQLGNM